MELAISVVTNELVSRFVSFLTSKYSSCHASSSSDQKQLERLQLLLLRARTIVEEADGRYITNSGMLAQLKALADAMYRGYWALGASRYSSLEEEEEDDDDGQEVSNSLSSRIKRCRSIIQGGGGARNRKAAPRQYNMDLQHGALERLETVVASLQEFVMILGGCDHMLPRRPYDTYLYIDNFLFGRHAEKQMLLNFLLQDSPPHVSSAAAAAPAVLPIISGLAVGKRTLVAHVCKDERVRSRFSSILRLNDSDFYRIADSGVLVSGRTLIVVEIVSYVDDKDWATFYSHVASMGRGSKVIIISRLKRAEEFGTVKPIFLNALTYPEFSYLFKALAFGSANPIDHHPRLAQIADRFAIELQSRWSILAAILFADVMRTDLNAHFWFSILNRCTRLVERNLYMYGEHPKLRLERGLEIDVRDFVPCPASPLKLVWNCSDSDVVKRELPKVTFTDLFVDPRPRVGMTLVAFESRIPPYTSFDHILSSSDQNTPLPGTKRQRVPF